MKLVLDDIRFSHKGFFIEKITKLSEKKLAEIEQKLTENIKSVEWANIDDIGFLSVSWIGLFGCYKAEEQKAVIDTLNKILKNVK